VRTRNDIYCYCENSQRPPPASCLHVLGVARPLDVWPKTESAQAPSWSRSGRAGARPLDAAPKPASAREVDGGVHAEPRLLRQRVDEAAEGARPSTQGEVGTLGEVSRRHVRARHPPQGSGESRRAVSRAVDDLVTRELGAVGCTKQHAPDSV